MANKHRGSRKYALRMDDLETVQRELTPEQAEQVTAGRGRSGGDYLQIDLTDILFSSYSVSGS